MKRRHFISIVGVAAVIGVAAVAYVVSGGWTVEPLRVSGSLWVATVDSEARVFFVTAETRETASGLRSTGFAEEYESLRLVSRAARDGADRAESGLARDGAGRILGTAGGILWLWQNRDNGFGVEGRDLETLSVRASPEDIRGANPHLAELLPNDTKFVAVSARLDALVVKTLDAQTLVMNPDNNELDVPPRPAEREASDDESSWFSSALIDNDRLAGFVAGGREESGHRLRDSLVGGIDLGDTWFGLLSAETFDELSRQPSGSPLSEPPSGSFEDVPYQLYRLAIGRDQGDDPVIAPATAKTAEPLRTDRYLRPGLITRYDALDRETRVLQLLEPRSVLLVAKPTLADESHWYVERMTFDGEIRWRGDTGLALIERLLVGDEAIVLGGYALPLRDRDGNPFADENPYRLVHIDLVSGAVVARGL